MGKRWWTRTALGTGLLLCALGYALLGPGVGRGPGVPAALPDAAAAADRDRAPLVPAEAAHTTSPATGVGRAAVANPHAAARSTAAASEDPAADPLRFQPQPRGGRVLLVRYPDGQPVAGARVVSEPNLGTDLLSVARLDMWAARHVSPGETSASTRRIEFLADGLGQVRLPAWAEQGRLSSQAQRDGVFYAGERTVTTRSDATWANAPLVLRLVATLAMEVRVVDRSGAPMAKLRVALLLGDRAEPVVVGTTDVGGRVQLLVRAAIAKDATHSAKLRVLAPFDPPVELDVRDVRDAAGPFVAGIALGPHIIVLPEHGAVDVVAVGSPSAGATAPNLPHLSLSVPRMPALEGFVAPFEGNTARFDPVGLGLELKLRAVWTMESRNESTVLAGPTVDGEVVRHSLEPSPGVVNVRVRLLDAQNEPLVRRHVILRDLRGGVSFHRPVETGDGAELHLAVSTQGPRPTQSFVLEYLGVLVAVGPKVRQRVRLDLADWDLDLLPIAASGARDLGDLRLEVVPALATGWVEDPFGQPVEGVLVRAEVVDTTRRDTSTVVATAETDESGRFAVEDTGTKGPLRLIARRGDGLESSPYPVQNGQHNVVLTLPKSASFSAFVRVHEDLPAEVFSSELHIAGKPPSELALRNPTSHDFARLARGGALWRTSRAAVPVGEAEWVFRSRLGGHTWHQRSLGLAHGDAVELELVDLEGAMGLGALEFVRADGSPVVSVELRAVDPISGRLSHTFLGAASRILLPLASEPLEIEARAAGTGGTRIALRADPMERIERRIVLEPEPALDLVLPAGPWTKAGLRALIRALPADGEVESTGQLGPISTLWFDSSGRTPFPLRWPGRYRVELLGRGEMLGVEFDLEEAHMQRGEDVELAFDPASLVVWLEAQAETQHR